MKSLSISKEAEDKNYVYMGHIYFIIFHKFITFIILSLSSVFKSLGISQVIGMSFVLKGLFADPPDSFRMGGGCQKDQSMIGGWELSALPPASNLGEWREAVDIQSPMANDVLREWYAQRGYGNSVPFPHTCPMLLFHSAILQLYSL